jgi:uroporphyrinogen decarboxylase
MERSRIERALRGEVVDRPPIWFMRQAGRYLPEYRAVRERTTFLGLCRDPELAVEVTLQPVHRFGLDAAILFSDILLPLDAMGRELQFLAGEGPSFPSPIRTAADVRSLRALDPLRDLGEPLAALRLAVARSPVPVLGFAGSPFTLACYLVEGHGSQDWIATKRFMTTEPVAFRELLDRLADAIGGYLQAQVDAGAVAVQLFDTWAGALSFDDYRRFALPAARRTLAHVAGAPRIYFTKDASPFLSVLRETGADVIGLDWRTDMALARQVLGTTPVQGNLDPIALFAPPDEVRRRVRAIIEAAGPRGHVMNLGHGIVPETPIAGVEAMVDAVKSFSWGA